MSAPNLPQIFIEGSSHCGGMTPGLDDMWSEPEGKFVRATDYLELRERMEHLGATDHIICGRCLQYMPGHATGAGDICDCPQ